MSKKVSTGVLFLAGGAILGGLAGYGIEHGPLMNIFAGKPSGMAIPGQPYQRSPTRLDGLFQITFLGFGAIGGAVVGYVVEAVQKNRDKTKKDEKTPSA